MGQWMRSGAGGSSGRKRSSRRWSEDPLVTLPRANGAYVVFDAHAFRNAMNVIVSRARDPFTVVVIRPALPNTTLRLAQVVISQLRAGSGDLVGYLESAVAVMLHSTSRDGALRFRERLREAWRDLGGGELLIEMAEYPTEEQRAIDLLTADWSGDECPALATDGGNAGGSRSSGTS